MYLDGGICDAFLLEKGETVIPLLRGSEKYLYSDVERRIYK